MNGQNIVFIAQSLDGYIAGPKGELDWLDSIPNPDGDAMGYNVMMDQTDAIVMGRNTFDTVCGFGGEWPYAKHVFVLSHTLDKVPDPLQTKVTILKGRPGQVLQEIHARKYYNLYIDGGLTIQEFLKEDLIDELRITTFPILLGGGYPLFGPLKAPLSFELVASKIYLDQLVQNVYKRKDR